MRTARRVFGGSLAAAMMLLLSACGSGGGGGESGEGGALAGAVEEASGMEELVAAAEEEGRLIFYSVPDEAVAQGIAKEFSSRYDIEVEFVRLVSADLAQRYAAEAESGVPAADLILMSDSPFFDDALGEGWLTPLTEAGIPDYPGDFPEEFLVDDGVSAVVSVNPTVLGYNTELVTETPEDWTVLTDPKWKGKVQISDPTTSDANVYFWDLIREEYGEDLLRQIGANQPTLSGGAVPSAQAIAAGEGAIAVPAVSVILDGLKAEGAPVDYVMPDVTTGSEIAIGISTEAANPNAARLFAHFLLTKEGNELLTLPYNTASPYGGNLPAGYKRPNPEALDRREEIYELLGAG